MKRLLSVALVALASPSFAKPLDALPMLPSIPRVKVMLAKDQMVVVEEINFPRGEWHGDPFDVYVAFGAPGAPRAVDAHLVAVADGALEPDDAEQGTALVTERAPRRPATAHGLLGRETMAGIVVHLDAKALGRAFTPGNMAALRIRTALDLPEEDPSGARGVLVRLGASRGTPLTLGRVVVAASGGRALSRSEARLCGPEADAHLLATTPRAASPPEPPIAPVLAVRHPTDDLCVKLWTAPAP
jgi:hypothetical protein